MLRHTLNRPVALVVGATLLFVGGGSTVALAVTDPAPTAVQLASTDPVPTLVLAEGVLAGAAGTGAYRAPKAPEPVADAPVASAPTQAPAPVAEPVVAAPAQAAGALRLPTIGFDEVTVENVEPVDGVLKPHGDGLARAVVPGVRANLRLIHSGRGAAGDLLADRDAAEPSVRAGDPATLEDGSPAIVLRAEILDKGDFSTIPWVRDALRAPGVTVLVSCARDSDHPERSPLNVVVVIGPRA